MQYEGVAGFIETIDADLQAIRPPVILTPEVSCQLAEKARVDIFAVDVISRKVKGGSCVYNSKHGHCYGLCFNNFISKIPLTGSRDSTLAQ